MGETKTHASTRSILDQDQDVIAINGVFNQNLLEA